MDATTHSVLRAPLSPSWEELAPTSYHRLSLSSPSRSSVTATLISSLRTTSSSALQAPQRHHVPPTPTSTLYSLSPLMSTSYRLTLYPSAPLHNTLNTASSALSTT